MKHSAKLYDRKADEISVARELANQGGSAGRAAAGALRIGNAIGAAFTNRRVLEPVEARLMLSAGAVLLALAILFAFFPRVLVYPLALIFIWIAVTLLYKGFKLYSLKSDPKTDAPKGESSLPRGAEVVQADESIKDQPAVAGDSIKPGVERSGTPG